MNDQAINGSSKKVIKLLFIYNFTTDCIRLFQRWYGVLAPSLGAESWCRDLTQTGNE